MPSRAKLETAISPREQRSLMAKLLEDNHVLVQRIKNTPAAWGWAAALALAGVAIMGRRGKKVEPIIFEGHLSIIQIFHWDR